MRVAMKLPGIRRAMVTVIAGAVVAALSLPALAAPRHSGGRGPSTAHAGGHAGGHAARGHSSGRHIGGARHVAPRIGLYLGAPLVAAAAYYGPRYHYHYPPAYVTPAPQVYYYCAAYNDYYPRVPECPSGWQQVIQPAPYYRAPY